MNLKLTEGRLGTLSARVIDNLVIDYSSEAPAADSSFQCYYLYIRIIYYRSNAGLAGVSDFVIPDTKSAISAAVVANYHTDRKRR